MIFGIGTDILEISRIDKIFKKYNQMMEERRQQRPGGTQNQGTEGQRSRGRGGE